jgi:hypothetical protein
VVPQQPTDVCSHAPLLQRKSCALTSMCSVCLQQLPVFSVATEAHIALAPDTTVADPMGGSGDGNPPLPQVPPQPPVLVITVSRLAKPHLLCLVLSFAVRRPSCRQPRLDTWALKGPLLQTPPAFDVPWTTSLTLWRTQACPVVSLRLMPLNHEAPWWLRATTSQRWAMSGTPLPRSGVPLMNGCCACVCYVCQGIPQADMSVAHSVAPCHILSGDGRALALVTCCLTILDKRDTARAVRHALKVWQWQTGKVRSRALVRILREQEAEVQVRAIPQDPHWQGPCHV